MNPFARFVLSCWIVCSCSLVWAQDASTSRVDALFAAWNKPDTPGLSLAVIRDGVIVYGRGYGMANLEYGVHNTPGTVFHVASVSKQFTSFAIQLLAQDGKLSLDDDVRKYLPELQVQVQGPPITIRHLIHHTSGLRDQWSLLMLAGLRLDDVITENDILGMLWQQKQLNFAPGDEELYSNSGYTLLGQIVKRVSGQTLAEFAQARIFDPLGMKNTHFQETYGTLVKGRAYSYRRSAGRYQGIALSYSNTGATSLMTTVEDLARWDQNFYDARVGGTAVVAAMQTRGKLNNGREIAYASGLVMGRYRELPSVEHDGADAGYRTDILRFPEQHLSVVLLANAGEINAQALAHRVADIYLEGTPGLGAARTFPAEVTVSPQELEAYAGDFEMQPGFALRFTVEGAQLMVQATGQPKFAMFAAAGNRFFTKAFEAAVTFDKSTINAASDTATWRQRGRDMPLRRITLETPSLTSLQACAGNFYSDELNAVYRISVRDGKLRVRYPRGEVELAPITAGVFSAPAPLGSVRFSSTAAGACDNFTLTTGRVRSLRFTRIALPSVPQ